MARRRRADMIEETQGKLIASARQAFARLGYADASMEEITAQAGLTRGALYHHFGDKKGLFAAVVFQIDDEIDIRLQRIGEQASTRWEGFRERCRAYLTLALDAEVRRIVLSDARAVLGERARLSQPQCIASLSSLLAAMVREGDIADCDCDALACMLHGSLEASALWIAEGESPPQRLERSLDALNRMLAGIKAA